MNRSAGDGGCVVCGAETNGAACENSLHPGIEDAAKWLSQHRGVPVPPVLRATFAAHGMSPQKGPVVLRVAATNVHVWGVDIDSAEEAQGGAATDRARDRIELHVQKWKRILDTMSGGTSLALGIYSANGAWPTPETVIDALTK